MRRWAREAAWGIPTIVVGVLAPIFLALWLEMGPDATVGAVVAGLVAGIVVFVHRARR